jgi:hypothetical protein
LIFLAYSFLLLAKYLGGLGEKSQLFLVKACAAEC